MHFLFSWFSQILLIWNLVVIAYCIQSYAFTLLLDLQLLINLLTNWVMIFLAK
jgi:hypothetical protein